MAGHSILYLGRSEFASSYLAELETLPCCTMLTRSAELRVRADVAAVTDVVLLEAGPMIAQSGNSIGDLIHSLSDYPVVALTRKEHEHRGVAAVRAGAEAFICIDDVSPDAQEAVLDHAMKRFRLRKRLSDTDVTVLSVRSHTVQIVLCRGRRTRYVKSSTRFEPPKSEATSYR